MRSSISDEIKQSSFLLIDPAHPLAWSRSQGDGRILILQTQNEPKIPNKSSKGITVSVLSQPGGSRWALAFVLNDRKYSEMFDRFCEDVVDSSRKQTPESGPDFAYNRFNYWTRMFRPDRNQLSEESIRGLIGELVVLKDVMIPKYGEEKALAAWMNRKHGKQDFTLDDHWYEVKTILEGVCSLTITSLEQLDRDDAGSIIVVQLRKASTECKDSLNLNSIVDLVDSSIQGAKPKDILYTTLDEIGYSIDSSYDDLCFDCISKTEYVVDDDFPRIRKSQLMPGIISGSYDISIDSITEYRVNSWN